MWGDADVVRYIGGVTRSPQDVWFASVRGRGMWDVKGFGYWTVLDRETGTWLGEAGFSDFRRGMSPDLSEWPEAGWAFGRASWGRGIGSEVVKRMHAWLDETHPGKSVCIIDEDNVVKFAQDQKVQFSTYKDLTQNEEINKLIDGEIKDVNESLSRVERVKKFTILPKKLYEEDGEVTPTMKVKRSFINKAFGDLIEAMY